MSSGDGAILVAAAERILASTGAQVDPRSAAAERLATLAELVAAWGDRMNLTAHRAAPEVLERLVGDAVGLSAVLPAAPAYLDLGSGAGFPGFPLAILRPEVQVTLLEPREKRHHFQREVVRRLGLENVELVRARAEDEPSGTYPGVVSQALASPGQALPWMLPWARPGGWLGIPAGESPSAQVAHPEAQPEAPLRYWRESRKSFQNAWLWRRRARGRSVSSGAG